MADKKKMSVADILAAARKTDSAGSEAQTREPDSPGETAAAPEAATPPAGKPAAKPASGGRPSVADMLAAARGEKAKSAEGEPAPKASPKPAPAPAAKPAAAKAAAAKAAAATGPKPSAAGGATTGRGPLDTASILAAARKSEKAGPVSKAEAAKLMAAAVAAPVEKTKPKPAVPPMPVKPAYAQRPAPAPAKAATEGSDRRGFLAVGWWSLAAVGALWTLATARFMYPNVLREPPSRFKVGFPGDFAPGTVEEKYKAQFGVWVVNADYNGEPQLFALKSVCTHLGCTPNWLEAEQKFKCPCHGSGFYKDGINFEGPAPRPLERYAIRIADDGQVEIDKSRTFQEEMGAWADPSSFVPV